MKIFILLSFAAVALATRECGENSHYESCGTACPLTCKNYKNPPKFCVLMCNPGCHCDKGYVKTDDGRCVAPEECPAQTEQEVCGENQVFKTCGTACPLTCDNYLNPRKICTMQCVIGCACADGFVKNSDGRCVRPEECPARSPVCGENQVYTTCGTACPLTCDNYQDPPKVCTLQCVIGCACASGYVKTSDGRCVRPEECPARAPVCGENQVYTTCGTACPLTCDNYQDPPKVCTLQCVIGCACASGYVKTSDGRCVRPEECPARAPVCGENQVYTTCGTACPLTCDNYQNPPKVCTLQCVIGCACASGYVKTSDGRCVRPEECSASAYPLSKATMDLCELPAETGPCRAFIPRYYFDKSTRQCEKFVYGGCQGNSNNFQTEEDCRASCGNKV